MKRYLVCLALLFCVAFVRADQPKTPAAIIAVPEVDQLQWSNLRLQAANLRLQADAMDTKASDKLTEIKSRLGGVDADRYDFELTKEGKMQLVRRPEPKKEVK